MVDKLLVTLLILLTVGSAADAAVTSYAGPTYGRAIACNPVVCEDIAPLPQSTYTSIDNNGNGVSTTVSTSVLTPASPTGIDFRVQMDTAILGSGTGAWAYYFGEVFQFQIDTPTQVHLGGSFFRIGNATTVYDNFSIGWGLCNGAGGTSGCTFSSTPGWSYSLDGGGHYPPIGFWFPPVPAVTLAPGTYSVWAYALESNGGPYGSGVRSASDTLTLNIELAAVPIPAAAWLFGGALGALGSIRRRQAPA